VQFVGFYYMNISQCTVLWMSNLLYINQHPVHLPNNT